MLLRLLLVYSVIMVIFVHSVHCNFGDFFFNLPLKLSDGVTSLARIFEENFKYHSPNDKLSYKRSDLLSKIKNSFIEEATTPAPTSMLTPVPVPMFAPVPSVHGIVELKSVQPYDFTRVADDLRETQTVADEDLVPVVPLTIPYIPQPKSGLQDFFRSVQPLEHFGEFSVRGEDDTEWSDDIIITDDYDLGCEDSALDEERDPLPQSWHIPDLYGKSTDPDIKLSTTNKDDLVIDFEKFRVKISSDMHFFW